MESCHKFVHTNITIDIPLIYIKSTMSTSNSDAVSEKKKVCNFFSTMHLVSKKKEKECLPYFISTVPDNKKEMEWINKD